MAAYRTCLALVFTAALACDDGIGRADTPLSATSGEPGIAQTTPDPVEPESSDSAEQDTIPPITPLSTQNEFCLPFEMDSCHGTTGRMLADCPLEDCMCQMKVVYVKYAPDTANCLSLACPKHYPDPGLLASCYHDWFLSIEGCLGSASCTDWATACPESGVTQRLQFLRSCLGG